MIDDQEYIIRRLAPSPGLVINRGLAVTKCIGQALGQTYHAIEWKSGRQSCNCPDAQYRRRRCKHLLALEAIGSLVLQPDLDPTPLPQPIVEPIRV